MEPTSLYAASDRLKALVQWPKVSEETEWEYFGAENEVNEDFVIQRITNYFTSLPVVVVINRQKTSIVRPDELRAFLNGILGYENFYIWDEFFTRVIEFSRIGVMRKGYL